MINIAEDIYNEGKKFEHPWQFWVVDNFLHKDVYNKLLEIKNTGLYELVDTSNGIRVTKVNPIASKKHIRIRQTIEYNSFYKDLEKNCIDIIAKHPDLKNQVVWTKDTNFVFDLVRCEPKYAYQKHKDHVDKLMSIVVYLEPDQADGTILFDSNNNEYNVVWKPNRALIFTSKNGGPHRYCNTTSANRFSLNVYIVGGRWEFDVRYNAVTTNQ